MASSRVIVLFAGLALSGAAVDNALAQSKGNYTEAAKTLGIHPNNLHRMIRTLDLKAAAVR